MRWTYRGVPVARLAPILVGAWSLGALIDADSWGARIGWLVLLGAALVVTTAVMPAAWMTPRGRVVPPPDDIPGGDAQ